jgi:hypothetical protein
MILHCRYTCLGCLSTPLICVCVWCVCVVCVCVCMCEECGNVAETTFRAINLGAVPGQGTKCKYVLTRFRQDLLTWLSPTLDWLIYVYCVDFTVLLFLLTVLCHIDWPRSRVFFSHLFWSCKAGLANIRLSRKVFSALCHLGSFSNTV